MALVVQDGTNPTGANSYADSDTADAYALDHGASAWTDASSGKDEALIRATAAIDATYRGRFPGWKTFLRAQLTEWPRTDAYDDEDNLIGANEVPQEVISATIEAAFRELATPGSMLPDMARGGAIHRVKAGSVEVEYADNAEATTTYSLIDGILSPVLTSSSLGLSGRTTRT